MLLAVWYLGTQATSVPQKMIFVKLGKLLATVRQVSNHRQWICLSFSQNISVLD